MIMIDLLMIESTFEYNFQFVFYADVYDLLYLSKDNNHDKRWT